MKSISAKMSQICCCPNRSQLKQNQMQTTTPKVKHESLVVAAIAMLS
ncbi:hypothetical protein PVAP13_1NG442819 [Panicum virgatum]|uniref:Uncharacterized protein n=1 Tax=Panicum virgatum TaxID=38727 RepID=A0A8T0X386_PANVG|nr:hypothetical protein PVAP13_1NG442819 [Panicum virgatum]